MLLKFTTADILNTVLTDVWTGEPAYDIVTVLAPPVAEKQDSEEDPLSESDASCQHRHTSIADASGHPLVSISWNGRRPDITILDEKIGQLTDLFGSSTVKFMPKVLVVPTRFDTEFIWTATPNSLTLFDYDTESIKGTFHQNVVRVPKPFTSRAKSPTIPTSTESPSTSFDSLSPHPTSSQLFSLSSTSLSSRWSKPPSSDSSHSSSSSPITHSPKSSFIPTYLPGVGSSYLEFCQHPLAHDVEIIVSFLMMEILRRGRFLLTPYTFGKPKLWQLKEARNLVLRRLRRNTV